MLINTAKGYEAGDLVTIKLVNGDELIARFNSYSGEDFVVEAPCAVVPTQQGIGLMQAVFTANPNGKFEIKRNHIMLHGETISDMAKHYIKTTSGIEIAPAGAF